MLPAEAPQPNGKLWLLVILVLLGFGAALTYFTNQNPNIAEYNQALLTRLSENRDARLYVVYYSGGVFSPTNLRIHAGDSVKFQNDSEQAIHIESARDSTGPELVGFDSVGDVPAEGAFTYTFIKAGTFGYNNSYNRDERGTVIVRPN